MTDAEKLSICVTALLAISGDPENDQMVIAVTGVDPSSVASIKRARRALAKIGCDFTAPVARRPS